MRIAQEILDVQNLRRTGKTGTMVALGAAEAFEKRVIYILDSVTGVATVRRTHELLRQQRLRVAAAARLSFVEKASAIRVGALHELRV